MTMWMVRSEGSMLYQSFREKGLVAIGWTKVGDLNRYNTREELRSAVEREWPDWKPQARASSTGILHRFATRMNIGDGVITYDKQRRAYAVGTIDGGYRYDPSFGVDDRNVGLEKQWPNVRKVKWEEREVIRDELSPGTRNTLSSTLTLFLLSEEAEREILRRIAAGESLDRADDDLSSVVEEDDFLQGEEDIFHDIEAKSIESIKDSIAKLDWSKFQELVAGLLRAMGYKTRVSSAGPDRGKDIVASPDGFGFEDPRIVVEVKHRPGTSMSSNDVRSFLGGRRASDKGLYVSTGGFSKDAHYEAERANIPVTLMDLDDLVEAILDNYERMDIESQRLVPLKRIYWPLS